jgi:hypothetical protein
VHQRPDESVSGTLVFAILHREKTNKVFGKRYLRHCFQHSQRVVFHPSQAALSRRIRRQLRRALSPPLIDDFDNDFNINNFDIDIVPSLLPSASPTTTATVGRYNPRDLILSFILYNMLICHTSMLYMLDLVHLFYMIYILVLIWKFSNYLTLLSLPTLCCSVPLLTKFIRLLRMCLRAFQAKNTFRCVLDHVLLLQISGMLTLASVWIDINSCTTVTNLIHRAKGCREWRHTGRFHRLVPLNLSVQYFSLTTK